MAWISGLVLSFSQFLTTASIAFTFWYGGILVNQNIVKAKQLYQVFFILMGTGKGIADAGTMTSDIAKSGKAIRSVFAILDRMSLIHPEDSSGEKVRKALRGDIEINNVFFSYPARPDHLILQGLTLKIKAGKTIALVGPSGCGKSTIIGLIERFYDPTMGTILIDDCDVKTYNLRSLRSHIGLVSQEPTLFAGTIRDNIAYGNENVAESEIKKAANLANADDFISSMKDGYSTWCGERGVQLSGGQKQRIAIARAILKNPEILLLDEATSALDSVSENMVQETLEKMMVGRTCIIIAHRLSTIQNADSIAVLKNGKVVELGSHSDLISNKPKGAYSSMIRLQNNRSATTTNHETGSRHELTKL